MGEIRFNPITGEPVILSTARADRPGAWSDAPQDGDRHPCPFCPGNESETPPELHRTGGEAWQARVVPNKYPAVSGNPVPRHEVLIDSPDHSRQFEDMGVEQLRAALELWRERFGAQESVEGTRYVAIFRNEGRAAGQSIAHPHSQILGIEFIPPRIEREFEAFRSRACPICGVVNAKSDIRELVVDERGDLVLFCPRASRTPFEMWLTSASHIPDWRRASDVDLAALLLSGVRRLRALHPNAAFNLGVVTAPIRVDGAESFHWYLEVVPRLTNVAGYEMSTGGWINIESPENAARQLRECIVRQD